LTFRVFAAVAGATALVYETIRLLQRCSKPETGKTSENPESDIFIIKAANRKEASETQQASPLELEPLKESKNDQVLMCYKTFSFVSDDEVKIS
jgi:hypothetical protein